MVGHLVVLQGATVYVIPTCRPVEIGRFITDQARLHRKGEKLMNRADSVTTCAVKAKKGNGNHIFLKLLKETVNAFGLMSCREDLILP